MKILHVGKFYSPIEGGIEAINKVVVDALKGNSQRIITFNSKNKSIEEDIDGTSVIRASSVGTVASQPLSFRYYWELKREIKLFNPDIIHFHYPNPLVALYLLLSKNNNSKLILHWHSDIIAQKFLYKFIRILERKLLKRADVIIATSPIYRDSSECLKDFKEKIEVIPCSIDESKFEIKSQDIDKIEEIKRRYDNKPIVFFVGRHVEYKGIEYLLKAEKYVNSDCIFAIAGSGPLTDVLIAKYSSTRVHWLGRLTDDEMRIYMHAASIYAFPSITKNEAFGIALAEAMYCDCAPITFSIDGSGVNWVSINGETGIEVPNKDIVSFAKAITELISNPSKRDILANNARKRVIQMFTTDVVKHKYLSLYHNLYQCTFNR